MDPLAKNPLEQAASLDKGLEKDAVANPNMVANEYSNAPYSLIKRWTDVAKKPNLKPGALIPSA